MQIGSLKLANPVIAAPLSGITDKAFRLLAEEAGCGLVSTEMISVNALAYENEKTKTMFDMSGERGPTCVQIFGNDPCRMAAAAEVVVNSGAGVVDINMGCPAPKVVKNFEGCALMTNLSLARKIIEAVVKAVDVPVTIKIRKGWDKNSVNAVELAEIAESCGAAAVTVHGRTRDQFYSGRADWDIIARVRTAVSIPVIGNGDIKEPPDALSMIRQTGCDGVMIGRGALGNLWLFRQTVCLLETGKMLPDPDFNEKIEMAIRHLQMVASFKGEHKAVTEMRKHIAWYLKGIKNSVKIRELINKALTVEKIIEILQKYLRSYPETS